MDSQQACTYAVESGVGDLQLVAVRRLVHDELADDGDAARHGQSGGELLVVGDHVRHGELLRHHRRLELHCAVIADDAAACRLGQGHLPFSLLASLPLHEGVVCEAAVLLRDDGVELHDAS